jgi:hypothetical protein
MKPETKARVMPLLAHWMEDGKFIASGWAKPCLAEHIPVSDLILVPERYSIYVEPRVIYVNESDGHLAYYTTKPGPGPCARFIEDLNWKPDLDADHHLPDHTPPHLSKQATDYMKTV